MASLPHRQRTLIGDGGAFGRVVGGSEVVADPGVKGGGDFLIDGFSDHFPAEGGRSAPQNGKSGHLGNGVDVRA